jgi:zinc transport system substrate-binding protein
VQDTVNPVSPVFGKTRPAFYYVYLLRIASMKFHFGFILCCAVLLGCANQPAQKVRPLVAVSIPPQKYFVGKIAGNLFDVLVMVPPGASPHTYEPRPSQMTELSKAQCYFATGVEFEKAWLARLAKACPSMTIINTDSGIKKIPVTEPPEELAKHAGHDHEGLDPHTWLSPLLARQQAHAIAAALSTIDPPHAELFMRNDSLFAIACAALHDSIQAIIGKKPQGTPFLVFHPSWGYFAREFGLTQVAIEVDGKEPSPAELGKIFETARKYRIKTIYVQPQFSRRSAQIIAAELGAAVVTADPLAENWEQNLLACARSIAGGAP